MEFVKINDNFEIGKYPVTNGEYEDYCREANKPYPKRIAETLARVNTTSLEYQLFRLHPVVHISKTDAEAFCNFYNFRDGANFHLPTESEWELAAGGKEKRVYPWGNEWHRDYCNTYESGIGTTTPVGSFPQSNTPEGVCDMAGNVWEWTANMYGGDGEFIIRGCSWKSSCSWWRQVGKPLRSNLHPNLELNDVGFRVVRVIPSNSNQKQYEILYKDPKTGIIYPNKPI